MFEQFHRTVLWDTPVGFWIEWVNSNWFSLPYSLCSFPRAGNSDSRGVQCWEACNWWLRATSCCTQPHHCFLCASINCRYKINSALHDFSKMAWQLESLHYIVVLIRVYCSYFCCISNFFVDLTAIFIPLVSFHVSFFRFGSHFHSARFISCFFFSDLAAIFIPLVSFHVSFFRFGSHFHSAVHHRYSCHHVRLDNALRQKE